MLPHAGSCVIIELPIASSIGCQLIIGRHICFVTLPSMSHDECRGLYCRLVEHVCTHAHSRVDGRGFDQTNCFLGQEFGMHRSGGHMHVQNATPGFAVVVTGFDAHVKPRGDVWATCFGAGDGTVSFVAVSLSPPHMVSV